MELGTGDPTLPEEEAPPIQVSSYQDMMIQFMEEFVPRETRSHPIFKEMLDGLGRLANLRGEKERILESVVSGGEKIPGKRGEFPPLSAPQVSPVQGKGRASGSARRVPGALTLVGVGDGPPRSLGGKEKGGSKKVKKADKRRRNKRNRERRKAAEGEKGVELVTGRGRAVQAGPMTQNRRTSAPTPQPQRLGPSTLSQHTGVGNGRGEVPLQDNERGVLWSTVVKGGSRGKAPVPANSQVGKGTATGIATALFFAWGNFQESTPGPGGGQG